MLTRDLRRAVPTCLGAMALAAPVLGQCEAEILLPGDPQASDFFGWSSDGGPFPLLAGSVLVVGAPFEDEGGASAGAAYVFLDAGEGFEMPAKLIADDAASGDQFGTSVAVDGDLIVVGAPFDQDGGTNTGAAYVFRYDGAAWLEEAKLTADPPTLGDQFGISVAIHDDLIAVGAHWDDQMDTNAGAAWVFRYDPGEQTWNVEAKLTDPAGFQNDRLGRSVAVNGDVVLAGAPQDDELGLNTGAVFAWTWDGATWDLDAQLLPSTPQPEAFGSAIAFDGMTAAIGAPGPSDGSLAGTGYILGYDGATWIEEAQVAPVDGQPGDDLGRSAAVEGVAVLFGARYDSATASDAGAAYLCLSESGFWLDPVKLSAADAEANDEYGASVSLASGVVLVGAPKADPDPGTGIVTNAGGVYLEGGDGPGLIDCNNNGTPDLCEIEDETTPDCNGNEIPDECEIADGDEQDCNDNEVPDSCDFANGDAIDCNGNGFPDACDIADGTSPDDNGNGRPDECDDCNDNGTLDDEDIANGDALDCNDNGVPDECDIAEGTSADDDGDGIPDECFSDCNANGRDDSLDVAPDCTEDCSADCNGNGVPDECDVFSTSEDCNDNEIPDECEEPSYIENSGQLSPIGQDVEQFFILPISPAPIAGDDVTLSFTARADLGGGTEAVEIWINGVSVGAVFDDTGGADCPLEPAADSIVLTAEAFNDAVDGGDAMIMMIPTSSVDPNACDGASWIEVGVEFHFLNPPSDCNGNGTPDFCDINSGASEDINGDGVPDECLVDCNGNGVSDFEDIAEGTSPDCNDNEIPDECDAPIQEAGSLQLGPIGDGEPQSYLLEDPAFAGSDVTITVTALADLGGPSETIDIQLNGTSVGTLFAEVGDDCNDESTDTLVVSAPTWNVIAADGDVLLDMVASAQVDADCFGGPPWIIVDVEYQPITPEDCNGNGVPDFCDADDDENGLPDDCDCNANEILDIEELMACDGDPACDDCNGNGIPDACDIAGGQSEDVNGDGRPDECPLACPGDIDSDGVVNVADMVAVIAAWGPCDAPCLEDVDDDGFVSVPDLLLVIVWWGTCPDAEG